MSDLFVYRFIDGFVEGVELRINLASQSLLCLSLHLQFKYKIDNKLCRHTFENHKKCKGKFTHHFFYDIYIASDPSSSLEK